MKEDKALGYGDHIQESIGLGKGNVREYGIKEDKMKQIFENEEEAIAFYKSVIKAVDYQNIDIGFIIGMTKQHGYLKKSPLEEARKEYDRVIRAGYFIEGVACSLIRELEKALGAKE